METAVVDRILQEHEEMHARVSDWEAALAQLASPGFTNSQRGLQQLWKLVPFFEKEVARHFRAEEAELYPRVGAGQPQREALLGGFAGEHAEFNRQWQAYKRELLYCDAVGETRQVHELGTAAAQLLRRHMRREEAELLPLVEKS